MASAACSPADPPFHQFGEYYADGAAGMWQQAAQQPQLAFVPTAADYAACEPALAPSYPAAAGWQQQGQAYPAYLPMMAGIQQPVAPEAQQAADALGGKKRLRWSAALHARFVDAVKQLGGALQATPKRIQLLMAVPGLSLLHVKSHLQKYRNALTEGRPAGPRSRPAGVACRRRGVMSKRSAATMRSTGSNGDGGSGSDGEWEEDAGSGAGSGAGSPTVGLGLGGFPEQLSRRNSKHFRPSQPEEAAAEQQPAVATGATAQQGGAAAAAAAGMGLEAGSMGQPLPSMGMGWGSASDFAAVEAELEAALAPVDAQLAAIGPEVDGQCGTDDEDGALLDLPEGLALLDRQLSNEAAQGPSAAAEGTRGTAEACPSGSGGQSSSSGLAMTVPLAVTTSPPTPAGPTAPALPDAADAAAQQRSSAAGGGSGSSKERLLEAALRMQLEMQRQLSSTMEAQRQLQKQLEEHGRYIEGLLRSEGALSSKPPAPKAAPGSKPQANGAVHRRSGSSCSIARPRSASGTASPALWGGLPRAPQQPASLAPLALPPLALPVPPLPPGWHALPHITQQQAPPQQAQQAQHAEGWLDQLLPAGDAQRAEQEAAASQLSPADVDLLLGADSSPLQHLLHQPCGPVAVSRQQAQGPTASHFSQRSQPSDGMQVAPGGAAGPAGQPQQAQQAQQALVGGGINADMWDSLLLDSGVLHQLLAEEGRQAA